MQLLTRGKIISVLLEDCEIGSLRIIDSGEYENGRAYNYAIACQWNAFIPAGHVGTDRIGAERERPVDVRPVQILSHRRKRTDTVR